MDIGVGVLKGAAEPFVGFVVVVEAVVGYAVGDVEPVDVFAFAFSGGEVGVVFGFTEELFVCCCGADDVGFCGAFGVFGAGIVFEGESVEEPFAVFHVALRVFGHAVDGAELIAVEGGDGLGGVFADLLEDGDGFGVFAFYDELAGLG